MNTRRFLIPALGALLFLAPLSRAQQATTPAAAPAEAPRQEQKEKMRDHMAKELGLTDDQQAKLKGINQQEHQALKAVHDDSSLTPDQRKAKAQEIRKNFEGQRNAILTPDQQKKAAEMKEKAKEHHGKHRGPKPEPEGK